MPLTRTQEASPIKRSPSQDAFLALTAPQRDFLWALPKAELHAHLNGSIPLSLLQQLGKEYLEENADNPQLSDIVKEGISQFNTDSVKLNQINDFFNLFPAIYAVTNTPLRLARATTAVLRAFLSGPIPQCEYLELRTTPRTSPHMTRQKYLEVVLEEIEFHSSADNAVLIVSLDRRMTDETARECLDLAIKFKQEGRRVVGVDLCGDPLVWSHII